jgi:hypothetical protein
VQLHTHRHRVSNNRELFLREIEDNRRRLDALGARGAAHVCYPGGFHLPEFAAWLRSAGVRSATTCKTGMISKDSDPYLLPRLVDTGTISNLEFKCWLSGLSRMLPRLPIPPSTDQLMEDQPQ